MAENFINVLGGNELTDLLRLWLILARPDSLDRRIVSSLYCKSQLGFASPRPPTTVTEVHMKRCNACDEVFEDKFNFCAVDGTPLNSLAAALERHEVRSAVFLAEEAAPKTSSSASHRGEFKITIMSSAGLMRRLRAEISFVIEELKRAWPDLKSDPIGFGRRLVLGSASYFKRLLDSPNLLAGTVTAILVVLSVVLSLIMLGHFGRKPDGPIAQEGEQSDVQIVTFLSDQSSRPKDSGVGAGLKGRVGLARGKGEGSEHEPKKAGGGGGGGSGDLLAAQQGRPPQPSAIPAPIPKFPPIQKQTLPLAGIDIDVALWKNLPFSAYGDPRSKATAPSNGPGDGGGMGTSNGTGIGEGTGPGFGPGENGNIGGGPRGPGGNGVGGGSGNNPNPNEPDRVYIGPEVSRRARVLSKPEPPYTEEARRNNVTGSVILRVVFSRAGEVTNIRALKTLPLGLTEKAIAAARQIRFIPAMRNGQPVSMYMQLEYNFNLY
jgi:TonB family protein